MTRTRRSDGRVPARRHRLRFETLEERSLLAVAALHFNLYEDVGGSPGPRIANDTVRVGQSFFVEVTAREHDPGVAGLGAVFLDIAWDADALDIVEPFDPRQAVTPNLPLHVGGKLHQKKPPTLPFLLDHRTRDNVGHIDGLGGSAFEAWGIGSPIGSDGDDRYVKPSQQGLSTTDNHFAWLHFRAEQAGKAVLTMRQSGFGVVPLPVASLSDSQLYFETQTITILANQSPQDSASEVITVRRPDGDADIEPLPPSDAIVEPISWQASEPSPGGEVVRAENVDSNVPAGPEGPVLAANDEAAEREVPADALADTEGAISVTWRNPADPHDVDGRDGVTALDVLIPVNYINAHPDDPSLPRVDRVPPPYYDVNGDKFCTAHDALLVLNFLERRLEQVGQGEGEMSDPAGSLAAAANAQPAANGVPSVAGLDAPARFAQLPELLSSPRLGRAVGLTDSQSDAAQRWSVSRREPQTGWRPPAARMQPAARDALFGSPKKLEAVVAEIEELIDALAAGWAAGEGDASCPRSGKTLGER